MNKPYEAGLYSEHHEIKMYPIYFIFLVFLCTIQQCMLFVFVHLITM